MQSPPEYFRLLLLTVVGQAFTAAGYTLEERPTQWAGGLFRFSKKLAYNENPLPYSPSVYTERGAGGEVSAFIEYQLLAYAETDWSSRTPSRFRVTLTRTDQPAPNAPSRHPHFAQRDLSALVVEDFKVAILPSAAHWWTFSNTDELGKTLAESGHLVIGFGLPWLSGELTPPSV